MLEEVESTFEKKELARIKKKHSYSKKPEEGYTYMQLKSYHSTNEIHSYRESVGNFCNSDALNPFVEFSEFLDKIKKNDGETNIKLILQQSPLLRSGTLVQLTPQNNRESKVAPMAFLIEISNYTPDYLFGKDMVIRSGHQEALIFWHAKNDNEYIPLKATT